MMMCVAAWNKVEAVEDEVTSAFPVDPILSVRIKVNVAMMASKFDYEPAVWVKGSRSNRINPKHSHEVITGKISE